MTTLAKRAANQSNAKKSTGPKTQAGKVIAKMNALSHGLRAASPTVPGEDVEKWEQFRDGLVSDLAPLGFIESELADRVALLSWRLRRVTCYEASVITRSSDSAVKRVRGEEVDESFNSTLRRRNEGKLTLAVIRERVVSAEKTVKSFALLANLFTQLAEATDDVRFNGADATLMIKNLVEYLPEDECEGDEEDLDEDSMPPIDPMLSPSHSQFLRAIGVPADHHSEPEEWEGWTAGVIRLGAAVIANTVNLEGAKLLALSVEYSAEDLEEEQIKLADLAQQLVVLERATAIEEAAARRRALVPSAEIIEVVLKYEGHLSRQLVMALHELERRQALRSENPPQPPSVIDVTVNTATKPPALPGR